MKGTLFLMTIIPLVMACHESEPTETQVEDVQQDSPIEMDKTIEQNFKTSFELDGKNSLVVTISPGEGAFFASPESKNHLKGYVRLELDSNDFISIDKEGVESPASQPSIDPYSKEEINWIREETTFTYGTCRKVEKEFEVGGVLSFVIEPECSRYEVGFVLKNHDSQLKVQKLSTRRHNLTN